MVELNEMMKDCLIDANDNYPDLDFEDTVFAAFSMYVNLTGAPLEIEDEEEGIELLEKARLFILDCVLLNMVRDGIIEVDGIEEDGDLVYKLTRTVG